MGTFAYVAIPTLIIMLWVTSELLRRLLRQIILKGFIKDKTEVVTLGRKGKWDWDTELQLYKVELGLVGKKKAFCRFSFDEIRDLRLEVNYQIYHTYLITLREQPLEEREQFYEELRKPGIKTWFQKYILFKKDYEKIPGNKVESYYFIEPAIPMYHEIPIFQTKFETIIQVTEEKRKEWLATERAVYGWPDLWKLMHDNNCRNVQYTLVEVQDEKFPNLKEAITSFYELTERVEHLNRALRNKDLSIGQLSQMVAQKEGELKKKDMELGNFVTKQFGELTKEQRFWEQQFKIIYGKVYGHSVIGTSWDVSLKEIIHDMSWDDTCPWCSKPIIGRYRRVEKDIERYTIEKGGASALTMEDAIEAFNLVNKLRNKKEKLPSNAPITKEELMVKEPDEENPV